MNLEYITQQIKKLNHVLQALSGVGRNQKSTGRRKISAAGRRRISLAQQTWWRKITAGKKRIDGAQD
jgi:hypothetical protein